VQSGTLPPTVVTPVLTGTSVAGGTVANVSGAGNSNNNNNNNNSDNSDKTSKDATTKSPA
jgi:hypothetical protein